MYDGLPTKVTKEEKLEELAVAAANKAIDIVKTQKDEVDMDDPRERISPYANQLPVEETMEIVDELDVKKPKATNYKEEVLPGIREPVGE